MARDFGQYQDGRLPLDLATADVRQAEAFFARRGIRFQTRVFDLGMMGYRLAGARVHTLARRVSALFVYRSEGGRTLLCQMYEGDLSELPAGAEQRRERSIDFRIYRTGGLTLVFWEEGEVVCVLISDVPPEEVMALAAAKAVKL